MILEDIETILRTVLQDKLGIDPRTYKVCCVVLFDLTDIDGCNRNIQLYWSFQISTIDFMFAILYGYS